MQNKVPKLHFENLWGRTYSPYLSKVAKMWQSNFPALTEQQINERLQQIVFVIYTDDKDVVGVSTSFKAYIPQLKHHLYNFRCFIDPAHRVPGLVSKLIVQTRDFLESIYMSDGPDEERGIGMITLVENDKLKKFRNEAIWPASGMVFIGNTPKGYPIRVYYSKRLCSGLDLHRQLSEAADRQVIVPLCSRR